ncbi:MAG: alanine racemase [Elusimicrobiota bacterium]|nr:alanine racemase [Elusimicrobiota bacterium]
MSQQNFSRPIWTEINLSNLKHNLEQIRKFLRVAGSRAKIIAVVKTNAYGHGLVEISKKCIEENAVSMLGVTSVEEGIALRNNGITLPVLILGTLFPFENFKEVNEYNLTPTIASIDGLKALEKFSCRQRSYSKGRFGGKTKFHLKIDTGMGRIGISPGNINQFLRELNNCKNVVLEGVFTHFSSANSDTDYTLYQIREFETVLAKIRLLHYATTPYHGSRNDNLVIHACNSAAMLKFPQAHYSCVRPGLCIYGLLPFENANKYIRTLPVLSWKTRIVFIKHLPKGISISYNRTFITKRPTTVATIPVGYGDGYNRKLSNRAKVIVRNNVGATFKVPVIGRVTMDLTMIDVTQVKNVRVGDEVILIGPGICVEDLANWSQTINYEIVCNIHPRVPRIYVQ